MATLLKNKPWKSKLDLLYVSDEQEGYTRRKRGKGFTYLDNQSQRISCKDTIKRIKVLSIPPIWENVWICKTDKGHLQSTGRDLKKRKQYIYHNKWMAFRQASKFSKMLDFAKALPKLRKVTDQHLSLKKWSRKKVLALAVKVLDQHYIRIGNLQYAKRNGTYGLTTLRRKHLDVQDGELVFSYKAKSNKYRSVSLEDKKLMKLVKECSELPGYEVFRYKDKKGQMHAIDSSDVNEYIHNIMGDEFTAKDFRTWAGTSLAVQFYPEAKEIVAENSRKKLETTLVKMVAKELGNTMSVCRKYYIHPHVLKLVKEEKLPTEAKGESKYLEDYEMIAKEILEGL